MKIGGWKTRSVFERYAIVSHNDVEDALEKLEQRREPSKQRALKRVNEAAAPKPRLAVSFFFSSTAPF